MLRPCPAHDRGEASLRRYVHPAGLQVTAPLHQPLFPCASSGWAWCAREAPPVISARMKKNSLTTVAASSAVPPPVLGSRRRA
jgi:hypothetical protein